MKYLHLTAIALLSIYMVVSTDTDHLYTETKDQSVDKITVDWQHPVNRAHPEAMEFKEFSKRKIAQLYHMNIQAEKQFAKHGYLQTEGKVGNIVSDISHIVFQVKKGDITIQQKVLIYAKPPQKLVLSGQ